MATTRACLVPSIRPQLTDPNARPPHARPDVRLPRVCNNDHLAPLLLPRRDVEGTGNSALTRIVQHFLLALDQAFVIQAGNGYRSASCRRLRLLFELEPWEQRRGLR